MEQLLEANEIESCKEKLQEIIKPYQQEQNQRQKKADFLSKCVRCIEKNDFFQIDELLRSKQAIDLIEDPDFQPCRSIFQELQKFTEIQIDNYRVQFRDALLQLAKEAELPLEVDFPKFFVLKGIEGKLDFANRNTIINQITIKSLDPKRIIFTAMKLKRSLYDTPFEPQIFIDTLLNCYQEILKKEGHGVGEVVPIQQLYLEYVWSLQTKTFFQNMEKGKFKGYSVEQFAVDLWRFFQSPISHAEGGYQLKMNAGRIKSFWLIDQDGEKRQISHAYFIKT